MTGYGGGATGITIGGAGGPKLHYGDRGMFCGGLDDNGDRVSDMNSVDVTSTGNANDFGNLRSQKCQITGAGGGGRGLTMGGERGPYKDEIDYWTFSTLSNASDFGNLSAAIAWGAACSNGTNAYYFGGQDSSDKRNEIDKVTIATTANATAFSGLLQTAEQQMAACADASRGVKCAGASSPYGEMDYITFDNEGNAVDFGNATERKKWCSGCSNETIGLIMGGWNDDWGDSGARGSVDKITIQTTANASSFSSFSGNRWMCASAGNATRALGAGGKSGSNNDNSTVEDGIYYWGYSGGGSGDFGDLQEAVHETPAGMSGD